MRGLRRGLDLGFRFRVWVVLDFDGLDLGFAFGVWIGALGLEFGFRVWISGFGLRFRFRVSVLGLNLGFGFRVWIRGLDFQLRGSPAPELRGSRAPGEPLDRSWGNLRSTAAVPPY